MKKYKNIALVLLLSGALASCNILDLEPPTGPTADNFIQNPSELEMALNAAYRSTIKPSGYGNPFQQCLDSGGTDIGLSRIATAAGSLEMGQGVITSGNGDNKDYYSFFYTAIARVNYILEKLPNIQGQVTDTRYKQYEAEALFLRAYYYHYLTELWGDVPYVDFVPRTPKDALLPRTPKATVVTNMMADLQTAAAALPNSWSGADKGRVTKGAALGLRARVALYNSLWSEAAASSKAVMDMNVYSLYASYEGLFQPGSEGSSESIFYAPFQEPFNNNSGPNVFGSRVLGMTSNINPTQSLVDSYEATDGKTNDKSDVYDPKKPYDNRDPRLRASIVTPGSAWAGIIFESHPDSAVSRKIDGTANGQNKDSRSIIWAANFCGYMWKKYADEANQKAGKTITELDFMLMRYAEILLINAEANIELGGSNISQTMLDNTINKVRARAYGKTSATDAGYPRITTTSQTELRTIIKRERVAELALEGFRLFDIRRWKIAEKVMPVTLYGQMLDRKNATKADIPTIDADGFVNYSAVKAKYDDNPSAFPNALNRAFDKTKNYLNPIPQDEIDTYKGNGLDLPQNGTY